MESTATGVSGSTVHRPIGPAVVLTVIGLMMIAFSVYLLNCVALVVTPPRTLSDAQTFYVLIAYLWTFITFGGGLIVTLLAVRRLSIG